MTHVQNSCLREQVKPSPLVSIMMSIYSNRYSEYWLPIIFLFDFFLIYVGGKWAKKSGVLSGDK